MMRRVLCIALALILGTGLRAQDRQSEAAYAALDSLIIRYVGAIQAESVETKTGECDFLIGSVKDSLMRNHVAAKLFSYYREAPVMGDEAVAIYLYDEWFAKGKVAFRGEFEGLDAEMFCNMNRNTLLGMDAPSIAGRKACGGRRNLPAEGVTSILWFYDTSCSKCVAEAKLLPGVLEREVDFPVTLVAFYTGSDRKAWREFRRSFRILNPNVRIEHYWDPSYSSDYQRLYAVISTPKMYLIAPEGSVIGRRLELDALPQLLPTAKEIHGYFVKKQ
jgi:hypothetical protein